jgi:hypothetical protein
MSSAPAPFTSDSLRYKVEPVCVTAKKAGRRLHLGLEDFRAKLPELLKRGFPPADPTTGMFYLPAIDRWLEAQHNGATRRDDSEIDRRLDRAWGG